MFLLNTLKDYKLYNKEFTYPINDKDKFKDNIIFLDSFKLEDSINLINNSCINNKYTKCYFIDRNNTVKIKAVTKRKLINQDLYYKEIKNSCSDILKTYTYLDKYNGLSVYYDLSVVNELFFSNVVAANKQRIDVYKTYLNTIMDNEIIDSYKNKFILCQLDEKTLDYDSLVKGNLNNFLSIILKDVYLNLGDLTELPNFTVIVLGKKSKKFFKFNLHSLEKTKLVLIKKLFNITVKLEKGLELSNDEKTEEIFSEVDGEEENTTSNKEISKIIIKDEMKPTSTKEKEINMKIDRIIDSKDDDEENISVIEDNLNKDEEFLKYLEELKDEKLTAALSSKNTARNDLLKEEQKKVKVGNKTIEQIVSETKTKELVKDDLGIENKNKEYLNQSTMKDFEKSYNENLDEKDKMLVLNSFSDDNREIKVYVRNISKEDSSSAFTKKETWTIDLEDDRRIRHTIKVDFPLFIEDKFLFIEGNKKILSKQLLLLPVVKTGPDRVQLVTNSNKTFISRFGAKLSPKMEKFKKFINKCDKKLYEYRLGDNTKTNLNYLTNIEYDELSKIYSYITIDKATIYFNQNEVRELFNERKFIIPKDKEIVPIGIINNKPIVYNMEKNILYMNDESKNIDIIDFIVACFFKKDSSLQEVYDNISVGKKYTYSRCDILSRNIPLIIFLAYNEGLSTLLNKAKINYELSDKRKVLSSEEKERKGCIPFKDKYLYYDIYPLSNSLLLNALLEYSTKDFEYELFDSKEVYLELFQDNFGSRAIAKGFDNFYELFIDGITKEVLEDLNYPSNVTDLFLYANKLLEDNQFVMENDMSNYRLRSNEIINAIFYKAMEQAYITYKNSINGATPIKMSLPQDKIIKELTTTYSAILQDYNILNPITETDSISTVTYKGPGGLTYPHIFGPLKNILTAETIIISISSEVYIIKILKRKNFWINSQSH